jgi:hypothetical protein
MRFVKELNHPLLLIIIYVIKVGAVGATIPDALIVAILAALIFGLKHLNIKQQNTSENEFRNQVSRDLAEVKTKLSSINLQQGMNIRR